MSEPFVSTLRTSGSIITLGPHGANPITIRVEVPERWDVALLSAANTASVRDAKEAALQYVSPDDDVDDYVIKLRGFEVLDESVTLAQAGARDGSIFLLTHRRRRPVR